MGYCSDNRIIKTNIAFCCKEDNDLYKTLKLSGYDFPTFDDISTAIDNVKQQGAILVLADEYPRASIEIDKETLKLAAEKNLRMYIEYPKALPDIELGFPASIKWERGVISSDFFYPHIEKEEIVTIHGCWYMPLKADKVHMVIDKVAGYRKAVYGITKNAVPILFELAGREALVATTKLSQFITGRYGPKLTWKKIWERILQWLTRDESNFEIFWNSTVEVGWNKEGKLPEGIELNALEKSLEWFKSNIVHSFDIYCNRGAIEGFESCIDYTGKQTIRSWVRSDCTSETGMVFAFAWAVNQNPFNKQLATQLIDCVWSSPDFIQNDPSSPAYGLNNWYQKGPVFYGDDNARVIIGSLVAGRLIDENCWDEYIIRCLLANFRTTGPLGFRQNALRLPKSFENKIGWEYYWNKDTVIYAPHYQAYLWACYLWAYSISGYSEFLKRSKVAIRMTMEAYPNDWNWTNGLTQEMARMLLPLAYLIRIEDTDEHRSWLMQMAKDIIKQIEPCGAIREKLGPIKNGKYPPPDSNAVYGKREASVIQTDGDPACDLLYTANWALLGFHEAYAATKEEFFKKAEDRLMDFICRIQIKSTEHPYLNGAWMRCFDYDLWEYWGSSADAGWGAWCVESGWTNSWIASILAMRQKGYNLFDLMTTENRRNIFPKIIDEMLKI